MLPSVTAGDEHAYIVLLNFDNYELCLSRFRHEVIIIIIIIIIIMIIIKFIWRLNHKYSKALPPNSEVALLPECSSPTYTSYFDSFHDKAVPRRSSHLKQGCDRRSRYMPDCTALFCQCIPMRMRRPSRIENTSWRYSGQIYISRHTAVHTPWKGPMSPTRSRRNKFGCSLKCHMSFVWDMGQPGVTGLRTLLLGNR